MLAFCILAESQGFALQNVLPSHGLVELLYNVNLSGGGVGGAVICGWLGFDYFLF